MIRLILNFSLISEELEIEWKDRFKEFCIGDDKSKWAEELKIDSSVIQGLDKLTLRVDIEIKSIRKKNYNSNSYYPSSEI